MADVTAQMVKALREQTGAGMMDCKKALNEAEGVQFPIPGNDDAMRAITLYCDLVGGAVLTGLQAELVASGEDIGASEEPLIEAELGTENLPVEQKEPEVLNETAENEVDQDKPSVDLAKGEEDKAS